MRVDGIITGYNSIEKELKIKLHDELNIERIETMYSGDLSRVSTTSVVSDPRQFTQAQKGLMFALINDIAAWSGQEVGVIETSIPREVLDDPIQLKDVFYSRYIHAYQKEISVSNSSESTISDLNEMLEIIIDFMFEFNVPFPTAYNQLPKKENYYLYACCKHRKCAVCGDSHAEIHHIDAVGIGNDRTKIDHTRKLVICVCRKHHVEAHTIGNQRFLLHYHLSGIYLDYETFNKLGMMSQKLIEELTGGNINDK